MLLSFDVGPSRADQHMRGKKAWSINEMVQITRRLDQDTFS